MNLLVETQGSLTVRGCYPSCGKGFVRLRTKSSCFLFQFLSREVGVKTVLLKTAYLKTSGTKPLLAC